MVRSKKDWGGVLFGSVLIIGSLVTVAAAHEGEVHGEAGALANDRGVVETTPGNITMDFKDADINNVLRILSYKSGVNIISGRDVQGLVTIRLTDVPWEKALDVMLRTYGFAYEREGNIIRVTTVENLEKEELTTEVFVLNYAKASIVIESVRDILSERGRVRSDERTNVLIVTDIPTNIYKISQVVKRLDQRTPQVAIDAKIIETTLDEDDKLGIDWNIQVTARGATRPTTFPWNRLRVPGVLKSIIPESDTTATSETTVGSGGATTATTATAAFGTAQGFPFVTTDQFTFGTLALDQFTQLLEVLYARRNTRILSNPRITTLNNQTATILVGEVLAIPIFERNENTGNIEITGYSEKDLGVKLSVTPHVNDEGMILVELKPEISSLLGFDELTPEVVAPRFATRQAETQVLVRDGDTIAIGGLISEIEVDSVRKVPLLGDIPGLGFLFSQKTKTKDKTDLIFFVTVRVITDEDFQDARLAAEELSRKPVTMAVQKTQEPVVPEREERVQEGLIEIEEPSSLEEGPLPEAFPENL